MLFEVAEVLVVAGVGVTGGVTGAGGLALVLAMLLLIVFKVEVFVAVAAREGAEVAIRAAGP